MTSLFKNRERPAGSGDDGMALPMVIVFIVVIGALIAAMLMQSQSNFKTTSVTRNHQEKVYAANAALEYATQLVRNDPTLCPSAGTTATLPNVPQFGGRTVNISCAGFAGGSDGPGGFGLFVTGASGGGITTTCQQLFGIFTCADAPKRIVGPVYNGGTWSLSDTMTIQDGFAVQGTSGACPAQPVSLRFNPAGLNSYRCSAPLATPSAPWSLAEIAPSIPGAPAAVVNSSGCRVFSPGRYTAGAPLSLLANGQNYLRSGVYLLDNTNLASSFGQIVVAGKPNNNDSTSVSLSGACATAQATDTSVGGGGVVFLLAGNASITGLFSSLEVYSYRPQVTTPLRSPISVYQLSQAEVTGWGLANAASPAATAFRVDDFLGLSGAANVRISVHGAIYVPRSAIDMYMSNLMAYPLSGGIVTRSLTMRLGLLAGGSSDFGVRAGQANQRRSVRINISVLPRPDLTEKPILGTAEVDISNDSAHSISITSWRINEDTDLSTPT